MGKTSIEWTTDTWNPVTGCDRTSPGCDHCYALTLAKRLKAMGNPRYQVDGDPRTSGPGFGVTLHPDKLDEPLHWRTPRRVFVNSMSDLFHPDVPDDFIGAVIQAMTFAPEHTFQVLTKRPQRMAKVLSRVSWDCNGDSSLGRFTRAELAIGANEWWDFKEQLPNVWWGTSIESDHYAFRADHLRATPAAVRFLSLEPLLGPLPSLDLTDIDWVIVGGESGPGARPMDPNWAREIRDQCRRAPKFRSSSNSGARGGRPRPTPASGASARRRLAACSTAARGTTSRCHTNPKGPGKRVIPMTDPYTEAIKRRAEAATPGPWVGVIKPNGKGPGLVGRAGNRGTGKCLAVLNGIPGGKQRKADTDFIAHCREDVPTLLAALEAAERENERMREAAATFVAKHESFHPAHWVAATPDEYCDACDFCAALTAPPAPEEGE